MFTKNIITVFSFICMFIGCQSAGPSEIILGKEQCDNCKMTIEDIKYAAELMTEKGKPYKFDDISCMTKFINSNPDKAKNAKTYVVDFKTSQFIETSKAVFVKGGQISSPMGGNTQAYSGKKDAEKAAKELRAKVSSEGLRIRN